MNQTTFAEELRAVRKALGLTQDEMAVRLGVKASNIRNWEQGRLPTHPTLIRHAMEALLAEAKP